MMRILTLLFTAFFAVQANAAVTFCVRGTLTARYNGSGGGLGLGFGNTAPTSASDAGALSGNSIQWAANANAKMVIFAGRGNTPNARTITILVRFRPNYTGNPAANQAIFSISTGTTRGPLIEMFHRASNGNLALSVRNEASTVTVNSVDAGAWSPTSGTWYDLAVTYTGQTTNALKVYADATLIGTLSPSAAWTSSWTSNYFSEIALGTGSSNGIINGGRIDEVAIWDTVEDVTSTALVGGNGSLNGASRSALVDCSSLDGSAYTDPGIANVRSTTSYTFAGSSLTGTAVIPTAANVKYGVSVDATTGTFRPSTSHGYAH